MKRLMLLLLLSFQTMSFINGSAEKPEGPITNLPNELLEKMALDIIMPQMLNAKTMMELDNARKNALKGFALASTQHLAIVKDPKFVKQVDNVYKNVEVNIKLKDQYPDIYKNFNFLTEGIDAKNKFGDTALITATDKNQLDIVKLLIKNGANINAKNNLGETALIHVPKNKEIVSLLIANGANINARSNYGETALIIAAISNYKDEAEILIKNKADINVQDNSGMSALMHATDLNHKDIVELLLKNGANFNLKNKSGKTAYDIAKERNHTDIIKLLEQYKK